MRPRSVLAVVTAAALSWAALPVGVGRTAEPARSYVVVLRDGTTDSPAAVARRAESLGAEIRHVYRHALRGYAAMLTPDLVDAVRRDPAVASVHADGVARVSTTQVGPPWGLDRIDQRLLPLSNTFTYFATGVGVKAYVIDTGIRYSHNEFGGRALFGFDAYGGTGDDCHGHGTHVAGTIGGTTYGVAKRVRLVAVRVLDCWGTGQYTDVIAGVDWVTGDHLLTKRRVAVANMSLGGIAFPPLDAAVSASIAAGISYSIAAGNSASDACLFSPARVPEAMTLAASDRFDNAAWFTNQGACVDWYAPGVDVVSAYGWNDSATASVSGTSMAAPHNAGVAAQYLEINPGATPAQVYLAIRSMLTYEVVEDGSLDNSALSCTPTFGIVCYAVGTTWNATQQDHLLFTNL